MTEQTTAQRKAARRTDATSTNLLRIVHLVEDTEGQWLSMPHPAPNNERGKTTAYLARTAAQLRFVRTLYQDTVIDKRQARLMAQAAERIVTLALERLEVFTGESPTPTPPDA